MRERVALAAPAVEGGDEVAQRLARLGLQFFGPGDQARGFHQRNAVGAGEVVQALQSRVAQAALGHIDDALEREVVGALIDEAQIGESVADFRPLVETRAADHAIGQAERDEPVLEFAHLERGAHQDGHLVELLAVALELLDLLAERARLLLGIPGGGDDHLVARLAFRAQRFAEPAFIVGDQVRGGAEDVAGRAVIAFEPDHLGAGEVVLEAQDVVDLRAAPAIDRLVVVADAADVSWRGGRARILRDALAPLGLLRMRSCQFGRSCTDFSLSPVGRWLG